MRSHSILASLILIAACVMSHNAATAQVVSSTIEGVPSCRDCTIQRYPIATVTDSGFAGGAISALMNLHVTSDASFFIIAPTEGGTGLFWAGQNGRVTRQVGRFGSGPGEYRLPQYILEGDKEYYVLDRLNRRITALSRADLQVIRSLTLPAIRSSTAPLRLPDGRFVFSGRLSTRDGTGFTLHITAADGTLQKSFREHDPHTGSAASPPLMLTNGSNGTFWVADYNRYVIEKWSNTGDLMAVYERRVEWFPPREKDATQAGVYFGTLMALNEDAQGRLWTYVTRRRRASNDSPLLDPNPASWQSIIEVLDPAARTVIATARVSAKADAVNYGQGSRLYDVEVVSHPSGEQVYRVWGYRLSSPVR